MAAADLLDVRRFELVENPQSVAPRPCRRVTSSAADVSRAWWYPPSWPYQRKCLTYGHCVLASQTAYLKVTVGQGDPGAEPEQTHAGAHRGQPLPTSIEHWTLIGMVVRRRGARSAARMRVLSRRFVGIDWNLRPLSGGAMARVYDISFVSRSFTERVQCLRTGLLTPIDQRHQLGRTLTAEPSRSPPPGI